MAPSSMAVDRPTAKVSHIPETATAKDLISFFEATLGKDSVYACEIVSEHKNWKSRGFGRVQFESLQVKSTAVLLSGQGNLVFRNSNLVVSNSFDDIVVRPVDVLNRQTNGFLYAGFMISFNCMSVLEMWEDVRTWIMPERKRVEFGVEVSGESFKMEIHFDDILESSPCCLGEEEKPNAILLKLKRGPKIYKKLTTPDIASRFHADRYHTCKEDVDYIWVRTTDFSATKSIGVSSSLCWEVDGGSLGTNIFNIFPYFKDNMGNLILEEGEDSCSASGGLVPLVNCKSDCTLPYEVLFQLNSLIHSHKISLGCVNEDVISRLSSLSMETATMILKKLEKLTVCYDLLSFIKAQLHVIDNNSKNPASTSFSRLTDNNIMSCYRALITPTKIYCLGPELETSNYVVKHYAPYASDFLRVSFVEEDWSKLTSNAISTSVQRGIFSKSLKTTIYNRIQSILQEGIVIGNKRFEFLAFSASQLRSNSVWMFASNENLRAENIREWMGCFKRIRSVSKCAARMGQLFSSSFQTLIVPIQDVEMIPDIEVVSDGVRYCFSDGIGKISLSFAKHVAEKCGLNKTPSAFQIRYGGYKGVVAVDRHSFKKLSLRNSMLKFESQNTMLNVTKWSVKDNPCYLNREIISLLSTLGIDDSVFEAKQHEEICLLDKMVSDREEALICLESMFGIDKKDILVKMLQQGYEPNVEPFLSMMLQAYRESLLSDLRTRCRISVSKGRILIGCMDETGSLEYGQVFVRASMTKNELKSGSQSFFKKIDDTTSVVIGKVVVTKNPCLHPGDIRVLEAVFEVALVEKDLVDCIVFPQKGCRPHPNECSGGDLDGDLYFICWDDDLIPSKTELPMDYTGRRVRIMDHDVTLEEIQKFFINYMINDTLGIISTAHLVHADHESDKALNPKCLHLANLHSMAVDFAKTGAPAEMPRFLKPNRFPDFMERSDQPKYVSQGILGKLFRASLPSKSNERSRFSWTKSLAESAYDPDLRVPGFEAFLEAASGHKEMYRERMQRLIRFYGARSEEEVLTGNLRNRPYFLQRDNRKYGDMKDRMAVALRDVRNEAREWFECGCGDGDGGRAMLASAWYHVTYDGNHVRYGDCLSFPWVVGDVLLNVKSLKSNEVENAMTI